MISLKLFEDFCLFFPALFVDCFLFCLFLLVYNAIPSLLCSAYSLLSQIIAAHFEKENTESNIFEKKTLKILGNAKNN